MEKFTPSELCADIKIYDYKQKVKYDEKSLVIFEKTGKMITAGKECEGMLYALPANSIGFSPIVLGRVSDYTCAEKMLSGQACFCGIWRRAYFYSREAERSGNESLFRSSVSGGSQKCGLCR